MTSLETSLRELRASGRKALVPYFVAGATPGWVDYVEAAIAGGADLVEIGLPFSDPVMDGVVIQEAALRALEAGTTIESVCAALEGRTWARPLVAMTYYNVFLHFGLERSAGRLAHAGFSGAIVPDLPPEEAEEWSTACGSEDLATIYLVAPSTGPERAKLLAHATRGFAYASARMAVTGLASGAGDGRRVVGLVREASDVPVYVGIGVSSPDQAADAASYSDGVIVGSVLVRRILDGATASDIEEHVRSFRAALDS